ncbi:MAG: PqqD family protein [Candidatus Acidiferrales bacterium]
MAQCSQPAQTMLTISTSLRMTKSQDGAILLDVEQGEIFALNPVGTRIVELLQEGHDEFSLTGTLSREFGVPEEVVKGDVDDFLTRLRQQHLIDEHGVKAEPRMGEK